MTTTIHDIRAIGLIAQDAFASVRIVERTAVALGIKPALRINGIDHFEATDAERMAEAIRDARANGTGKQKTRQG